MNQKSAELREELPLQALPAARTVLARIAEHLAIEQEVLGELISVEQGLGEFMVREQRLLDEVGHKDRVWRQIQGQAIEVAVIAARIAVIADRQDPCPAPKIRVCPCCCQPVCESIGYCACSEASRENRYANVGIVPAALRGKAQ